LHEEKNKMDIGLNFQSYKNYRPIENPSFGLTNVIRAKYLRMKTFTSCLIFFLLCAVFQSRAQGWEPLFNGKDLTGWDTYIGQNFDTVTRKWIGDAGGLNKDPLHVFSVVEVDGQRVLRISGERFGGISTTQEFENFHFRIGFKWGKAKWHPKKNDKRDSGILYHAVGPHGADGGFWMRSQEYQVQEGDCGDYWGVAGGSFEIKAVKKAADQYVYSPTGTRYTFNEKSPNGRRCIKQPDAEKPSGEWNILEIYCVGSTAVHVLNGKVVMVLEKSSQLSGNRLDPLTKGKIQIQSEGAEVFYRGPELKEITTIPEKLISQF
jgi:hypothetical protein